LLIFFFLYYSFFTINENNNNNNNHNNKRPERIKAIAERFGVDPDQALENILVARALTSEHQMELIYELAARFAQEKGIFKLLVKYYIYMPRLLYILKKNKKPLLKILFFFFFILFNMNKNYIYIYL